jgi:glycosyltransferase involved in cell wall biosynthesis
MEIGIVAPFHQLGGSEVQILLLLRGLQQRGVRVTLFHFRIEQDALRDRLQALSGLETCNVTMSGVRRPVQFLRETAALADAVKKRGIHVLHCWNYSGHIVGGIAARLAGVPALYAVRGLDPWKTAWQMPFYRLVNHLATGFVFQSQTTRDIVCRREGIPKTKITCIIPNGVDAQRFRPVGREQSRAPVILSVGSLRFIKGHDVLIDAVRILRSTQPELRFHVVIAGDGPLKREYEDRAADLPVSIIGFRDNTEELYNAADIYCQPSRSEAMPNSIMEAMSCGLPIVASRVGAVGELVSADNGRLFAPGDSESLARQLAELLTNRHDWPAMRDASLKLARRFSVDHMVEAHLDLYRKLAAA